MGEPFGQVEQGFDDLLSAAHRCAPDDLPALAFRHAAALGVSELTVYLIDLQQEHLVALPGPRGERPPLALGGTMAGQAYRRLDVLDVTVEQAEGPPATRVWLPLQDGIERLGVLEVVVADLDAPTRRRLWRFASVVALLVVSKRAYSDTYLRVRRVQEMSLSAEMQWALLPPLTFGTDRLVISGALEPAYEIGGDAFDYSVSGHVAYLSIFDSMGHDLAACLTASIAIGASRGCRRRGADLVETSRSIDEAVAAQFGRLRFVTALLLRLDSDTGRLTWINRGHPTPLLIRDGRVVKSLSCPPSPPMGLGLGREPVVAEEQLQPGDRLLLYSDGVVEGRSPDGEFFGLERFADLVRRSDADALPAPETLRRLIRSVVDHQGGRLSDDATILYVEWNGDQPDVVVP